MSKKKKPNDIEKGILNLVRIIETQKVKIQDLKIQLSQYQSVDVANSWKKMGVNDKEAHKVISMLENNIKNITKENKN